MRPVPNPDDQILDLSERLTGGIDERPPDHAREMHERGLFDARGLRTHTKTLRPGAGSGCLRAAIRAQTVKLGASDHL